MKKVFLIFALLSSLFHFVEAQVQFEHPYTVDEYNSLIQIAKANGIPTFVDCYTDWCPPCRLMTNNTFNRYEVGAYMNEKFMCIQVDMESQLGGAIASAFGIYAYPTLLFLSSRQRLIFKKVGYVAPYDFLQLARNAYNRR